MQTTIQKRENSLDTKLPKAFRTPLGITKDGLMELSKAEDPNVIKKIKPENDLTLNDIFKDYDGNDTAEKYDWGSPSGKEVW